MPRHPLQRHGRVDELLHLRVVPVHVRQLLAELQRLPQRDMQRAGACRHQLRHHVHIGIGHVQRPSHVPDGRPCRHGSKGHDLRHMVVAVLPPDVVHHLAPARIAEVHVDIRHGHALRVQKPLEVQVVLHGIDIRDLQAIGHHGARRAAAPRPHRYLLALGVPHEIRHDEEVVREPHLLDHVQLIVQLLPVLRFRLSVPFLKAPAAQLPQICGRVVSLRQLEFRQMVLAEGELHLAHLRDALRVGHRVRIPGEQCLHLLRGAQIEVLRLIPHPVLVIHGLACLDAQQHVVALGVLLAQIVGVVGAHHGNARLVVQPQDAPVHLCLLPDAVILQFQIEIALTEDILHGQRVLLRALIVPVHQPPGDLARQTRRQRDQPLRMLPQQVEVDAGLDVKALAERL